MKRDPSRELKDIEKRRRVGNVVVRSLSCGHEQVQPDGGRGHLSTRAICKVCCALADAKRRVAA